MRFLSRAMITKRAGGGVKYFEVYKFLVGNPKTKRSLLRSRLKCEDNIKSDLK